MVGKELKIKNYCNTLANYTWMLSVAENMAFTSGVLTPSSGTVIGSNWAITYEASGVL